MEHRHRVAERMKKDEAGKRKKGKLSLKQLLLNRNSESCPLVVSKYGPMIVEHCLLNCSIELQYGHTNRLGWAER